MVGKLDQHRQRIDQIIKVVEQSVAQITKERSHCRCCCGEEAMLLLQ